MDTAAPATERPVDQAPPRTEVWQSHRRAIRALGLGLGIVLIGVAALIERSLADHQELLGVKVESLTNLQEKHFEVVLAQSNYLVTLASALIAAVAMYHVKRRRNYSLRYRAALMITVMSAGLSLYLGYRVYEEVSWCLSVGMLLTDTEAFRWVMRLQFITLLAAGCAAMWAVFSGIAD
jgi:hypothetical protein